MASTQAQAQASTKSRTRTSVWRRLWQAGLAAAGIAALGNTLLYFVGRTLGTLPLSVTVPSLGGEGPITLFSIILMSLIPAVLATALLALLVRFTPRPGLIFGGLAAVVFIAMFFGPLTLPNAPISMIVTLEFMHVVTAAVIISLLFRALLRQ